MIIKSKKDIEVKIDDAIFICKQLSQKRFIEVQDKLEFSGKDDNMSIKNYSSYAYLVCKYSLMDWKNLFNEDGTAIRFPYNIDEALDMLPYDILIKIASEVASASNIKSSETKN